MGPGFRLGHYILPFGHYLSLIAKCCFAPSPRQKMCIVKVKLDCSEQIVMYQYCASLLPQSSNSSSGLRLRRQCGGPDTSLITSHYHNLTVITASHPRICQEVASRNNQYPDICRLCLVMYNWLVDQKSPEVYL